MPLGFEKMIADINKNMMDLAALPFRMPMAAGNAFVQGGQAMMNGQDPFAVQAKVFAEMFRPLLQSLPPELQPLMQQFMVPLNMVEQTSKAVESQVEGGEIVGQPIEQQGNMIYTQIY